MASILIAEDHPLTREGIKSYVQTNTQHRIVGECESGLQAIQEIAEAKPDLAIVDLRLPELDGLEVIRRTADQSPSTRLLVLSMHAGDSFIARAFRNGAHGYLLKNSDVQMLGLALSELLAGRQFVSPSLLKSNPDLSHGADTYDDLTSREREILQLVAEGKTSPDIRDRLFISTRTVEKHRSNMMRKLGLGSQAEVIRYAFQRGLIPDSTAGE